MSSNISEGTTTDTSRDRLLLGGGICHVTATLQLMHAVNKFLPAYVIFYKRINFWQYFVCLHDRIFNCCNVLMSS